MIAIASAPAKVILFGEHFVIHGSSAILVAIDKRITATSGIQENEIEITSEIGSIKRKISSNSVDEAMGATEELGPLLDATMEILKEHGGNTRLGLKVSIDSEIRPGIGLGSSAAACVATIASATSLFSSPDKKSICEHAIAVERRIHGTTSGADCYVSTYGGLVTYSREAGMKNIQSSVSLPLIICDTGITHSTKDQVANVERFKKQNENQFNHLLQKAQDIYQKSLAALENKDNVLLGALMNQNQLILQKIGVSHAKAEEIIALSLKSGGLGAKITGAGGGGAVIVLANSPKDCRPIISALESKGFSPFYSLMDSRGLVISKS